MRTRLLVLYCMKTPHGEGCHLWPRLQLGWKVPSSLVKVNVKGHQPLESVWVGEFHKFWMASETFVATC